MTKNPMTTVDYAALLNAAEKATGGPWRRREYGDSISIIGKPSWPCSRDGIEQEWEILTVDDLVGEHPDEMKANSRFIVAAQPSTIIQVCADRKEWTAAIAEVDRLGLIIEAAVRRADPENLHLIHGLLKLPALQAAAASRRSTLSGEREE